MRVTTIAAAVGRSLFAAAMLFALAPTQAQVKPALVRSVDEPARVPYTQQMQLTCSFTNQCTATFPAVPAGKRLRVTSVRLMAFFTSADGLFAVHVGPTHDVAMIFPVSPTLAAYYGQVTSSVQQVDLTYEAGETPMLEYGIAASAGSIFNDSRNRMGVSGYLVDVAP